MNWYLDFFAHEENPSIPIHQLEEQNHQQELREGPCEDDWEVTAPYIGILPDESRGEGVSPLNFRTDVQKHLSLINQEIDQAFAALHL